MNITDCHGYYCIVNYRVLSLTESLKDNFHLGLRAFQNLLFRVPRFLRSYLLWLVKFKLKCMCVDHQILVLEERRHTFFYVCKVWKVLKILRPGWMFRNANQLLIDCAC